MNLCVIFALFIQCYPAADSIICGVYINPYQASDKAYLEDIFRRADSGLINTIIVDFKGDYGFLAYGSELEQAKKIKAVIQHFDIKYLVEKAAKHDLKLIARIVCFRDNYLARYKDLGIRNHRGEIWVDNKGLAWTNPYYEKVHEYLLAVTKEVVERGVKSIAYDYIRFPTDGATTEIRLKHVKGSRSDAIVNFLKKVRSEIDAEIGVCVFGYATWYDLKNEGQELTRIGEYIDVLYPMLYPSHFPPEFKNEETEQWRNYWIYFDSVREAFAKLPASARVVPFVQGFDYRAENYNADYVFSQINGVLSAGAHGFIIWNARSAYSVCWRALAWAHSVVLRRCAQMSLDSHMRAKGRRYPDADLP